MLVGFWRGQILLAVSCLQYILCNRFCLLVPLLWCFNIIHEINLLIYLFVFVLPFRSCMDIVFVQCFVWSHNSNHDVDRPDGQPCLETKEFSLILNMLTAVVEERYTDAGNTLYSHFLPLLWPHELRIKYHYQKNIKFMYFVLVIDSQ